MSTKEAKNDVAVDKIAENDVVDAKADLKGTKRTADVSFSLSIFFLFYYCLLYNIFKFIFNLTAVATKTTTKNINNIFR